ncbi:magnesium transport protein cora [Rhypophila decipiens]
MAGSSVIESIDTATADTQSRDFQDSNSPPPISTSFTDASENPKLQPHDPTPSTAGPSPHVHYALQVDTNTGRSSIGSKERRDTPAIPAPHTTRTFARSDTAAFSPIVRRLTGRVGTFKTLDDFDEFGGVRPGWQPGSEPGADWNKPDGGHASMPTLHAPCDITIVDFSEEQISIQANIKNEALESKLRQPQPRWSKCRWININGLSWDVIKALGAHKNLHKLALEDIMNTRNRTKAEWFPHHTFIVLTLQKIVRRCNPEPKGHDSDDDASRKSTKSARSLNRVSGMFRGLFKSGGPRQHPEAGNVYGGIRSQPTGFSDAPEVDGLEFRTLQHYHASPNNPRTEYMVEHSPLTAREQAVACEQVSMFITNDNTIISFFELSAADVETPITSRLMRKDTIIRQSCDASMVGQAIIDAVIDLAIPVTALYGDVIGDLELDVLTRANLDNTKKLYILITEINKMLSFINPITTLINALRDHKTDMTQDAATQKLQDPNHGVIITPMTYTYLGDVLDHSVLITESLNQLKGSAEGMIDLIFNTVTVYQNESMRQLTIVTVIFLPLTFLTGYFGQNFSNFPEAEVILFWEIAIPVGVVIVLLMMRETIWDYMNVLIQRRNIDKLKRHRRRNNKSKAA